MRLMIKTRPLLALAAAALILLSSCGGAPQQAPTGSPPAVSAPETPSPSHSAPPSQTPAPSPSPSAGGSKVPAAWDDSGIFSDSYEKAYALLGKMTTDEKIGQLLLARCPKTGVVGFIRDYQPGGLVLYDADFTGKTTDGVIDMIKSYQNAAKIPLIVSTDEEGGAVVRISKNPNLAPQPFPSPQALYTGGGLDAVRGDTLAKADLLLKLGLNLNLAPVADVSVNPADFIYKRAFGRSADETGDYVAAVVEAMRQKNISASLKHFPGYGNNVDTHTGIAVDNRPYSTFTDSDFIPFERGIEAGAESILVSHNIVNCMDKDVPASLSAAVHKILRDDLHFTGVIMTDDLSMGAVKDYAGNADPYVQAVLAGNDMLLLRDYAAAFTALRAAVQSGEIPADMLDHAVFRILSWKLSRGIIA